jgi:branched-chain amino acid transport system ATP-binding protein
MTAVLELIELHTYYGHIHALKGITVEVNKGEIVTLVGANGAGKSTTLRTISGMIKPKRGSILLNGTSIAGMPAHQIAAAGVGHVPEGRRIFPQLTVLENLEVGAWNVRSRSDIQTRMDEVFELFPRLYERKLQKGGTLSGGEQQMLAIGRALMSAPRLLLLDEPSMGLAPRLVETMFDTIRDLRRRGTTLLVVEQNAFAALSIADRAYVLESGRIALEGPAHALLGNERIKTAYLGF